MDAEDSVVALGDTVPHCVLEVSREVGLKCPVQGSKAKEMVAEARPCVC